VQGYGPTYISQWLADNRDYTVSIDTVSKTMKKITQEWRDTYLTDIDGMKAAELARLDALIQEAWAGWYSSKKEKEISETEHVVQEAKITSGSTPKPLFEESKSKLKQENRDGDYKFLEMIDRCIARRCKILGLEAPSRHEIKDWRIEAEKAGFNPGEVFEAMVNQVKDSETVEDDGTETENPDS